MTDTRRGGGEDVEEVLDQLSRLVPVVSHPAEAAAAVERATLAWYDQHQVLGGDTACGRRLRASEIGRGVAAAFPWAGVDAVRLWSRVCLYFLAFDDIHAETATTRNLDTYLDQAGELWRMAHDTMPREAPTSPLAAVFRDLLTELDAVASATAATRVRQAVRDYFFATVWEAVARSSGTGPDPGEYRSYRRHAGQMRLNLEFVEHSPRTALTDEQRQDERIRRFRGTACDLAINLNDLCSVPVEVANGTAFGPDSCLEHRLHELPARCLADARAIVDITASTAAEPPVHAYCVAVSQWVGGTIWWHRKARRHRYRTREAAPGTAR